MSEFWPLRAIQNLRVIDRRGDRVGYIHEVLFSKDDGRIEYACIALATGARAEREVVVPWSAIEFDDSLHKTCRLAVRKSVIEGLAKPLDICVKNTNGA